MLLVTPISPIDQEIAADLVDLLDRDGEDKRGSTEQCVEGMGGERLFNAGRRNHSMGLHELEARLPDTLREAVRRKKRFSLRAGQ